ncbi:hypothetical protein ANN_06725 [Periplaneta americana]|uniref:Uncharacterized protein n=1 Tax=Periplaneta americana TaxID=6978 RepID=A0ABQ8TEB3_PERAM|nr:hypothetical protein ANN_06725 [Periplaneta americana]
MASLCEGGNEPSGSLNKGPLEWALRSPDLNLLDFAFWGYVKSRIEDDCYAISLGFVTRVLKNMRFRLQTCVGLDGAQTQYGDSGRGVASGSHAPRLRRGFESRFGLIGLDFYEILPVTRQITLQTPLTLQEKIQLVSVVPRSWSLKKVAEEFEVAECIVRKAKSRGLYFDITKNTGHPMPENVKTSVVEFYEDDGYSRVFMRELINYQDIDSEISKADANKFSNHLWYLVLETVTLTLFNDNVPTAVKANMAQVIQEADEGEEEKEEENQLKRQDLWPPIRHRSATDTAQATADYNPLVERAISEDQQPSGLRIPVIKSLQCYRLSSGMQASAFVRFFPRSNLVIMVRASKGHSNRAHRPDDVDFHPSSILQMLVTMTPSFTALVLNFHFFGTSADALLR